MIEGTVLKIGVLDHTGKVYKEVSLSEQVKISIDSPNYPISCEPLSLEWTAKIRTNRKSYKTIGSLLGGPKQRIPRKLKKKLKKELEKQIQQNALNELYRFQTQL